MLAPMACGDLRYNIEVLMRICLESSCSKRLDDFQGNWNPPYALTLEQDRSVG